jgi:hypothetical protein
MVRAAGIVCRIDVIDPERPFAADLDYGKSVGSSVVMHRLGLKDKSAGTVRDRPLAWGLGLFGNGASPQALEPSRILCEHDRALQITASPWVRVASTSSAPITRLRLLGERGIGEADVLTQLVSACPTTLLGRGVEKAVAE